MSEKSPIKIVISRRSDDYHACLEEDSRIWGYGHTINCAIGDLVKSHSSRFGTDIIIDQSMSANRYSQQHKNNSV